MWLSGVCVWSVESHVGVYEAGEISPLIRQVKRYSLLAFAQLNASWRRDNGLFIPTPASHVHENGSTTGANKLGAAQKCISLPIKSSYLLL